MRDHVFTYTFLVLSLLYVNVFHKGVSLCCGDSRGVGYHCAVLLCFITPRRVCHPNFLKAITWLWVWGNQKDHVLQRKESQYKPTRSERWRYTYLNDKGHISLTFAHFIQLHNVLMPFRRCILQASFIACLILLCDICIGLVCIADDFDHNLVLGVDVLDKLDVASVALPRWPKD